MKPMAAILFLLWTPYCFADDSDSDSLLKEMAAREKEITAFLSAPENWTNPKQEERLLRNLAIANVLRPMAAAPTLARNIMFSHVKDKRGLRTYENHYPACGVLKALGAPAIGALVDRLKKVPTQEFECNVILYTLVRIYAQGGFGTELAIARLELELSKTKDQFERANLEGALKWLRRGPEIKGLT